MISSCFRSSATHKPTTASSLYSTTETLPVHITEMIRQRFNSLANGQRYVQEALQCSSISHWLCLLCAAFQSKIGNCDPGQEGMNNALDISKDYVPPNAPTVVIQRPVQEICLARIDVGNALQQCRYPKYGQRDLHNLGTAPCCWPTVFQSA